MKYYRFIKLALFLVVGVLIGVYHTFMVENLKYTLPTIMIFYGVEAIAFAIYYSRKKCYLEYRLYWGHVEILLGLLVLTNVEDFSTICIVWAIWAILREAWETKVAVSNLTDLVPSIIELTAGLANVIFSILMIMNPNEHHATIHLYLLIVELGVASILPIVRYYVYHIDEYAVK